MLETGEQRVPYAEYEYGGPATCVIPPELLLHGCPTVVHELSPNAPEREAMMRLTYDESGRLTHWTSAHPPRGRVVEDATVIFDAAGRPLMIARTTFARGTWFGWVDRADTLFTWRENEVTLDRGSFQVIFRLDSSGRRTHHEVFYDAHTASSDWVYEGDRLERIDDMPAIEHRSPITYRFVYDCP
ncbi:MAG: hypothetical protein U0353_15080 [Sandaracinus sp.]